MKSSQQRHHFIPRFVLRQFRSKDQSPAGRLIAYCNNHGRQAKSRKSQDFLVNKGDFEGSILKRSILTQRTVSTEFALVDMYRDPGFDQHPYHLEKKLSDLESQASDIICRAFSQFAQGLILELKQIEVDGLRKFCFS
jgi:hypothetical protein